MSAGLAALLDDVAAIARVAAASVDDVAAGASRASVKAAGVIVDDTAVTPRYVQGFRPEREIPMIRRIALGSLRNKILLILPAAWHPDRVLGIHIPGLGVLLTLAILLLVGFGASNFLGKKLVHLGDRIVARIPVVRSIYSSVKQVSDTLFSESGNAFRTAVLVQ